MECFLCRQLLHAFRKTGKRYWSELTEKWLDDEERVTDFNPGTDRPNFVYLPGILYNDKPVCVCFRCNHQIKRKKLLNIAKRPTRKEIKAWQKLLTNKAEPNPSSLPTSTASHQKSSNS